MQPLRGGRARVTAPIRRSGREYLGLYQDQADRLAIGAVAHSSGGAWCIMKRRRHDPVGLLPRTDLKIRALTVPWTIRAAFSG